MLLKEKRNFIEDIMEKNIIRGAIYLLILALAILTLKSCGNSGGGSEEVASNNVPKLSWDPPTKNADGTSLNGLAGYKIYYGTSSGNYTKIIDIGDPKKPTKRLRVLRLVCTIARQLHMIHQGMKVIFQMR